MGQTVCFRSREGSYNGKPPKKMRPLVGWLWKLHRAGLRPVFVPVAVCADTPQRDRLEVAYIRQFRNTCSLFNVEDGGRGLTENDRQARSERLRKTWLDPGHRARVVPILQEAARQRIGTKASDITRARMRGRTPWNKGVALSAKAKTNLSEKLTGRSLSDQHKAAISSGLLGHAHSADTKAKIAASHIGLKPSDETRRKISTSLTGRRPSEETRAKLRAAQADRRARERSL